MASSGPELGDALIFELVIQLSKRLVLGEEVSARTGSLRKR